MAERISHMLESYRFTPQEIERLKENMVILIDTREKKNDHITSLFEKAGIKTERLKLDFGDYSLKLAANPEFGLPRDIFFDKEIVVERKANLEELSQNFTRFRANFKKELALAPPEKVVLIEGNNYSDLCHSFYTTEYNNKSFLASLHSFWHTYNCPFFFIKDKRDSATFIYYFLQTYLMERLREYEKKD